LSVTQVANPGTDGAAEVTVRLTVTSPGPLSVLGLTPLQVLLVHNGHVVVDRLGTYALVPR